MGGKVATVIGWMMGLIFVYLLVANSSGSQTVISSGTSGAVNLITALQGRGGSGGGGTSSGRTSSGG